MQNESRLTRIFIFLLSFVIVALVLWNTYVFYNQLKENERDKMEIFASAVKNMQTNKDELEGNLDQSSLYLKIVQSNSTTPGILYTHEDDSYVLSNIKNEADLSPEDILNLVEQFKSEYDPINITYEGQTLTTLYFGNSPIINKLKYYPAAILLMIFLFVLVMYFFYRTSKSAEQNKLWAGMAKETAHQIGTPLSSLVGWTEILKSEKVNPEYIIEIEKDISRLQTITERFSKVGSKPKLNNLDIVDETKTAINYLRSRTSKMITFKITLPNEAIFVNLNEQLYSWTIENLVKNGIDAMKGTGEISISIKKSSKYVHVFITDTGKGIAKRDFYKIFKPGYTTKKRGWGLGLSLAKRIIEEYHQGKIRVYKSSIDKGTTMEIGLRLEK